MGTNDGMDEALAELSAGTPERYPAEGNALS